MNQKGKTKEKIHPEPIQNREYTNSFLETLLFKIAQELLEAIDKNDGSICLIFVYDDFKGSYKLCASTKPDISFLKNLDEYCPSEVDRNKIIAVVEEFNSLSADDKKKLEVLGISDRDSLQLALVDARKFKELANQIKNLLHLEGFGFSKFCIHTEKNFVVSNASKHPILTPSTSLGEKESYSSILPNQLSSLLCYYQKFDNLKLLIRIETADEKKNYTETDIQKVKDILAKNSIQINSCSFLSNLLSIGYHIDLKELCFAAANTLSSLLDAKGCSIFLLDEKTSSDCLLPYSSEEYMDDSEPVCKECSESLKEKCSQRKLIYRCFGTTGLCVIHKNDSQHREPIKEPFQDAHYSLQPNRLKNSGKPILSLTEAVIWSRQNAYVDVHENDEDSPFHLKNQFTEPYKIVRASGEGKSSEHLWGEKGSQGYERSQCILYAPLFFRERNSKYLPLLGVIRILKPVIRGRKNYFKPAEMHLFFSFAEQLAKSILNAKYLKFFNELSTMKSEAKYRYIVTEVPKFIGGTDCAIYVKRGNQLKLKAEWDKGQFNYYEDDYHNAPSYDLDNPNEYGYTKWVAQKGLMLLFNSIEELEEQRLIWSDEERPRHKEKDSNAPGPERYIGIPIFREANHRNELLGVFRICKSSKETRFTKDDELVLSQICNRLADELEKSRLVEAKRIEVEHYFSKKLLSSLKEVDRFENVPTRLKNSMDYDANDITRVVLKLIDEELKRFSFTSGLKVFKDFELFNNEILKEVPYYRDHFIHQYVVYLLGAYLIDRIGEYHEKDRKFNFPHGYFDESKKKIEISSKLEKLWFITSLFHDISYPFAKTSEWYQKIFSNFIPMAGSKRIDFQSEILKYLFLNQDQSHLDRIDRLVEFHKRMGRQDRKLRKNIMNALTNEVHGMDHAVLSALVVMNEGMEEIEEEICGSAIIFHNWIFKSEGIDKINFCSHPLAFLLIFCDFFHEWGRERMSDFGKTVFHQLKNIIVTTDRDKIVKAGFPENRLNIFPNNNHIIYVFVDIEIADKDIFADKIKEADEIVNRLMSYKPYKFCFKVNHATFSIPCLDFVAE